MTCRKNPALSFAIEKDNDKPLILTVSSNLEEIAIAISYFLARETAGEILADNIQSFPLEILIDNIKNFNLDKRLQLADQSIWRQTSDKNPYPNLTDD